MQGRPCISPDPAALQGSEARGWRLGGRFRKGLKPGSRHRVAGKENIWGGDGQTPE